MEKSRKQYVKWGAYGLALLLCYILQSSYGVHLTLFSAHPNVLPFFVATLALYEGSACAAGFGFFAGILCDIPVTGADGLYPLFLMLFGLGAGWFAKRFMRQNLFSGILLGAAATVFTNLIEYLFYYALMYRAGWLTGLNIMWRELLCSIIFFPIPYFIIRQIHRHFDTDA